MFETAELGRKLSKEAYNEQVSELRPQLLRAQRDLRDADFGMLVLVHGVG